MKWKDSANKDNAKAEPEENYYDEEYSSLTSGGLRIFNSQLLAKYNIPLILLCFGIMIIIILLVVFIPQTGKIKGPDEISAIDSRLKQLDKRIIKLQKIVKKNKQDGEDNNNDGLLKRLNRLESSMSRRMEHITGQIESLQKNATRKTAVKSTKKIVKTQKKTSKKQYHIIAGGETLYSISRRYGLSVDKLRRLNSLSSKSTIQPGQKLVISVP